MEPPSKIDSVTDRFQTVSVSVTYRPVKGALSARPRSCDTAVMTSTQAGSPTVRRRRLGALLKGHREAAGASPEDVATAMETTVRTVRRWEAGQASIRARDLRVLLDLYRVTDGRERGEAETLAREGRQRGWWTPYTSSVRPTFATLLGLEAEATSYMEYSAMVLPGLLQTERYMRAVMNAAIPQLDDETIEKRIEVRRKRQAEAFARGYPCHFVIDQSCLHRQVGNAEIMNEQLRHLTDVAKSRRTTVQVIPFELGAHASIMGGFSVLTFDGMPPVAFVELLGGDLYADGPDSERYTYHFDKLREGALPEPLALTLVDQIRRDVHHAQ